MTLNGILQILAHLAVLTLLAKPVGLYLVKVYNGERTFLDFLFRPIERVVYAITRVDAEKEMNWEAIWHRDAGFQPCFFARSLRDTEDAILPAVESARVCGFIRAPLVQYRRLICYEHKLAIVRR